MSLYLVKDGDRQLWVAHETDAGQLYVYVPNTGRFHRNRGLAADFYGEQHYSYEPLSGAEVQDAVRDKVGKLDGRTKRAQLDRYTADAAALDLDDVLGELAVAYTPSPQRRAAAKAGVIARSKRGEWVVWKTYPAKRRQAAHVAANDLRRGRVAAIRRVGPVDTRVMTAPDGQLQVEVQVTQHSDELRRDAPVEVTEAS